MKPAEKSALLFKCFPIQKIFTLTPTAYQSYIHAVANYIHHQFKHFNKIRTPFKTH